MSDQHHDMESRPGPAPLGGFDLLMGVSLVWTFFLGLQVMVVLLTGERPGPAAIVAAGLIDGVVTASIIGAFVCLKHRRGPLEGFAIKWVGAGTTALSLGLGLCCGLGAAAVTAQYSTGESAIAELTSTAGGLVAISVLALVLPVVEELYYRGFIFPAVRNIAERHRGPAAAGALAVAAVSLWFGAVHVPQLWNDFVGIPVVATMGLLWTLMRHHYGSLLPSLLSHLTYNATLVTISLLTFEW